MHVTFQNVQPGTTKPPQPTSPASFPSTRTDAPVTLNYLLASLHIPGFPTCVKLLIPRSLPATPPPIPWNPSHPSRPSSNVISSMKALFISRPGCAHSLLGPSSNSACFVAFLWHFSYSVAIVSSFLCSENLPLHSHIRF